MPKKVPFIPYKCPRCGYETSNKSWMRSHLFTLKKPCQGVLNVMELTSDIKEGILANRIWHPLPVLDCTHPLHRSITNNINNYNTIYNNIIVTDDAMLERVERSIQKMNDKT